MAAPVVYEHYMLIENTKYCWAWNRIYVKANGRIPCWCDSGEQYTIIHKPFGDIDFINDIVNSEQMRNMRCKILYENKYYIKECEQCCCMIDQGKHRRFADKEHVSTVEKTSNAIKITERVETKRRWPKGSIDKIAEIQLEPSFPCSLKCPGCLHGISKNPLDTEPPPYVFPYEWFEHMVNSILHNEVRLNRIAFVGRGEPTLNHRLPDMIEYARSSISNLVMSMDTNSNSQFKPEYLKMNWINCSIDGSDQDSYSKYRKNGRLDKAIEFMKTGSELKRATGSSCIIRWKYILFNTNDSDKQLRLAQEIAEQLNIDELHFVLTHCGSQDGKISPSSRFNTIDDLSDYINNNKIFERVMCSRAT